MTEKTRLHAVASQRLRRLERANVIRLPYWRLTFAMQSSISIFTDDPQRIDIIAPGILRIGHAVHWARHRVPEDWILVAALRA